MFRCDFMSLKFEFTQQKKTRYLFVVSDVFEMTVGSPQKG